MKVTAQLAGILCFFAVFVESQNNCDGVSCEDPCDGWSPNPDQIKCCRECKAMKHGACPTPDGFGRCVNYCGNDSDCQGQQKCCSDGCGRVCKDPITKKHGACPTPKGLGACDKYCVNESDCQGQQKCCSNGCG